MDFFPRHSYATACRTWCVQQKIDARSNFSEDSLVTKSWPNLLCVLLNFERRMSFNAHWCITSHVWSRNETKEKRTTKSRLTHILRLIMLSQVYLFQNGNRVAKVRIEKRWQESNTYIRSFCLVAKNEPVVSPEETEYLLSCRHIWECPIQLCTQWRRYTVVLLSSVTM